MLDALERLPEARLEIAGDGEHRTEIEREIERRGLGDRVRLHGHVDERRKAELLAGAWVNVTASSNEGWCLTVMEAAACGTPSVAIAEGGLRESIVDGETGLLARRPTGSPALAASSPTTRCARGSATARDGACGRVQLGPHRASQPGGVRGRAGRRAAARDGRWPTSRKRLRPRRRTRRCGDRQQRDRARFTVVFARLLGAGGLWLAGGAAVGVHHPDGPRLGAADRGRARDRAGPGAGAGVRHWISRIALGAVLVAIAAVLLRDVLGAILNVDQVWAAAASRFARSSG